MSIMKVSLYRLRTESSGCQIISSWGLSPPGDPQLQYDINFIIKNVETHLQRGLESDAELWTEQHICVIKTF